MSWHKFGGHNHITNSAIFSNTWLTCTKNPYRVSGKLKYHMKLISMMNPMRLQLEVSEDVEMPKLMVTDYIDMENTIIEYSSNDVFGTLGRLHLSL
jgi:hypothetical protein